MTRVIQCNYSHTYSADSISTAMFLYDLEQMRCISEGLALKSCDEQNGGCHVAVNVIRLLNRTTWNLTFMERIRTTCFHFFRFVT